MIMATNCKEVLKENHENKKKIYKCVTWLYKTYKQQVQFFFMVMAKAKKAFKVFSFRFANMGNIKRKCLVK